MKTQIKKVMKTSGIVFASLCWSALGLGTEIENAQSKAQIEVLLVQARTALAQDRLTIPSGNNAVGYAQEVLNRSPGHPEAQRILKDVVERYGLIADAALDRAKALRAREVQKARTYRSRGGHIAKRYSLPDKKLQSVAERIAVLEKESIVPGQGAKIENQPQGQEVLKRVVARYLEKSEDALDLGGVKEARLYHGIAWELVKNYRLPETGLQRLDRHIAEAERDQSIPANLQTVCIPPAF